MNIGGERVNPNGVGRQSYGENFAEQGVGYGERNPIFSYIGAPNSRSDKDLLARDNQAYVNYQETRAYEGKNALVMELVTLAIVENNSFYTSPIDGLPIVFDDRRQFKTHEWIFDRSLVEREPEESVARVVRSKYREQTWTTIRRGQAIEMEHGFAHTDMGKMHFIRTKQQVETNILLTIFYDIVQTLMTCRARAIAWEKAHGLGGLPIEELAYKQAERTFVLQKSREAAHWLFTQAKQQFKEKGKPSPGCVYIPPGGEFYFRGVGKRDVEYMHAGPGAYQRRFADPYKTDSFANVRIHVTDTFVPESDGKEMDPLVRIRHFGNYNLMYDPYLDGENPRNPPTYYRDTFINDFNKDTMVRISFVEALRNCVNFDENGNLLRPNAGRVNEANEDAEVRGDVDIRNTMVRGGLDTISRQELLDHMGEMGDSVEGEMFVQRSVKSAPIKSVEEMHQENLSEIAAQTDAAQEYVSKYSTVVESVPEEIKGNFTRYVNGSLGDMAKITGELDQFATVKKRQFNALLSKCQVPGENAEASLTQAQWMDVKDYDDSVVLGEEVPVRGLLNISVEEDIRNNNAEEGGLQGELVEKAKNGEKVDGTVILFRPFQTFKTSSLIFLNGGKNTGFVAVSHRDAQIGNDTTAKRHLVHITFNSKAVVVDQLNVLPVSDIMMRQYMGGRSTKFYTRSDLEDLKDDYFVTPSEYDLERPSIIAIYVEGRITPTEMKDVIDIKGYFSDRTEEKHFNDGGYLADQIESSTDALVPDMFEEMEENVNTLCFQDHSVHFNPTTNKFDLVVKNKGHLGPNIFEGMRRGAESGTMVWEDGTQQGAMY